MKEHPSYFVLSALVALGALSSVACDDGGTDPVNTAGAPGVAGASGQGGGGGASGKSAGVELVPDATGWVDREAEGNTLGVNGPWYAYGDAIGDAKCLTAGHTAEQCSKIDSPTGTGFPNEGGKMCTSGSTAQVLKVGDKADFSNMWGAGIGIDINSTGGETAMKLPFNMTEKGVTGVGFNIEFPTGAEAPLRVEIPTPTTEGHTDGSAYWGATGQWPDSPVKPGWNEFRWDKVLQPTMVVQFNKDTVLGIQFHVPSREAGRTPFNYCISNLTLLTQ